MVIGTCSQCRGPVSVPSHMVNPVPMCEKCGARAENPYGPVIPMAPPNDPYTQMRSWRELKEWAKGVQS